MNTISRIVRNLTSRERNLWLKYYLMRPFLTTNLVSSKNYIKTYFHISMGFEPNLDNPNSFSEKLQWLKLYDHNPVYTIMVDKYAVKKYVGNIIGEKYIVPLIGKWDKVEDVEWEKLPQRFVIKCNHDSGGLVICKDKSKFDVKAAKKKLSKSLKRNLYYGTREWPYKDVKPCIIAEEYLEDEFGELRDYKLFCFDGVAKALFIATDRQKEGVETKFDFFDMEGNHLPFTNGHPNANPTPPIPRSINEMKFIAEKLSKGIPHVRVDFYEVNGQVFFGELTFYHWGGIMPFNPREWDYTFGSWLKLPKKDSNASSFASKYPL